MKIIVHIGPGKTGTSSIQSSLKENQKILNSIGFHNLGSVLEHAVVEKYSWQNLPIGNFKLLDSTTAYNEILQVFDATIKELSQKGVHTLIWSNASLLKSSKKIIPILQTLQKEHSVEIIAYVRKHEAWIRSAYVQWGIKHKTYNGKVKTFKEWYTPKKVAFYDELQNYVEAFPQKFMLKNMDAQKNLVGSFLDFCKIEDDAFKILKSNESPNDEEILLRALYNNHFQEAVLPWTFTKRFLKAKNQQSNVKWQTPQHYIESLLPSSEDIEQVHKDVSADREALNKILLQFNEEPIVSDTLEPKNVKIDNGKLLLFLTEKVIEQSFEINRLTCKVNEILEKGNV